MKIVKLFLLILALLGLLFCISCSKQLKSISDSVSGLPTEEGGYLDIGDGYDCDTYWQSDRSGSLGMSLGLANAPADDIESNIVQMSGDTVKFYYKISETDSNARSMSAASIRDYTFVGLHKMSNGCYCISSDIPVPSCEDNSNYKEGYVWGYAQLTFTLDSPGLYFFKILKNWVVIRKE